MSSCLICVLEMRDVPLKNATPEVLIMGQLNFERFTPNMRPFTYGGVDFWTPLNKNQQKNRERLGYIVLTIRAVHIKIAHSLSIDSAIMAIRREVARRETPKILRSENGKNYREAVEKLKHFSKIRIIRKFLTIGV